MIPYTTYTGTKTTKDKIQKSNWHWLMTPDVLVRNGWKEPSWNDGATAPYALDNGAWGCHTKGLPFNVEAFKRAMSCVGNNAEWVVIPDIVAQGAASLEFSLSWIEEMTSRFDLCLLPVQDGMTPKQVRPHLSKGVGLFVGGSTEWKLSSLFEWGVLAKQIGCHLHVARVNTVKRIKLCQHAGADSFDGTSPVRFPSTLKLLNNAVKQQYLWS